MTEQPDRKERRSLRDALLTQVEDWWRRSIMGETPVLIDELMALPEIQALIGYAACAVADLGKDGYDLPCEVFDRLDED